MGSIKIKNSKKGAILPLVSFLIAFVIFGMIAIVVDAGMVYAEKKAMVTAADSAALAGAQTLQNSIGVDTVKAKQVAQNFALSNGAATASAIIKNVRLNPSDHNTRQVIEVTTQVVKDNYFAKLIGFDTTTVNSHAVATWGFVKEYTVHDLIPIFTFSSNFNNISNGAIQCGLHGQFNESPPNYGYFNVGGRGAGNVSGIIEGTVTVSSLPSTLQSMTGNDNSIMNAVENRLEKAYAEYSNPEDRERYMTGLVPIIDDAAFQELNGGGDRWAAHLDLPVKYFAYFTIEDIIKQNTTNGLEDALYYNNYERPFGSPGVYYDGRTVSIDGRSVRLFDSGTMGTGACVLVGRFTGDTVEAIIKPVDGDQQFTGNASAAKYYKLIQ